MITRYIAIWKHRKQARKELESLTDRELYDIGILRCNIKRIVKGLD
jgi:uncharacterized protein YjiS (DUF1127 family)